MNPRNSQTDRILAVDDSPDNLFLIQTILETEGYDISLVSNGSEALAEVEKYPPDLILLDVMMPNMDGYEVTRRIRQNSSLSFIPILLITAYEQSSAIEGLDAGADDFIRKPVDVGELLARVRSLLRLKHSIDQQEQLARQREDFVSRLTHDLRTPLVAADRMLNLMEKGAFGELPPSTTEAITAMVQSNKNLLEMVNTVLEVYRHDAGSKLLTFVPVDVGDIAKDVIQELKPLASEKELALTLDFKEKSDTVSFEVMGDRLELRRVLTNLIGNAIKFTETGSVDVRLRITPATPDNQEEPPAWITVVVQDTGAGISPEVKATLFERFRQGKHKRSGSGLGLYLSRRIAEAHQGKIEVETEVDKGSVFTLYLPVLTQANSKR
ncbi:MULTISPECIES: hybrid sensor histidine kinase/response regulator [unclassified Coleofasciculus]|uniref:hybrid sensor histidine kinase/response regulator n=1 Tax=unclassified Coleofasciculus TaxID=2692782 RepID=UPI001882596B|nr:MULTISPECIES: hybrid sensor histidine kinase/response regulator [unclassified Coleofasciculus]MBE9127519.1 hybrid sensor histidine kinase/response regulator [Coleofasciculus sp. LEGE 07081]MBE9150819.1 hybrid sensor histidine kinase/response regulator [Coleofasciculus sp. LEGE 07092]